MTRTNLFKSNRTHAVRLPKDVAFPDTVLEVVILRDGPRRIIAPADQTWGDFFAAPGIDIDEPEDWPEQDRDAL